MYYIPAAATADPPLGLKIVNSHIEPILKMGMKMDMERLMHVSVVIGGGGKGGGVGKQCGPGASDHGAGSSRRTVRHVRGQYGMPEDRGCTYK